MSRVLIVTGGRASIEQITQEFKQGQYDLVFGVDHGMDYLEASGVEPDLILGDYDSCDPKVLESYEAKGIEKLTFPTVKDMTDSHLAVEIAIERGANEITLMGTVGTRFDHSLANIFLLSDYSQEVAVRILDMHNDIRYYRKGTYFIRKDRYDFISLIPLSKEVTGVSISGVKYPLNERMLKRADSYGVSNEILEEEALLTVGEGELIVIKSID